MKILIDIGHPAHVHLYKNIIKILKSKGNEVKITVREKDITCNLLSLYGYKYETIVSHYKSLTAKTINAVKRTMKLYEIAKFFKPDLMTGFGNFHLAHVGKLLGIPTIILNDTESARLQNWLTIPFCDYMLTPSCYKGNVGKRQIVYNGYHELSYLHPRYFKPDPSVLDSIGVGKNEKYVIVRFVSWGAAHDVGHKGMHLDMKIKAVKEFSKLAIVFITSEAELPNDLEKYKIKINPDKMHDMLYYASLLYGESSTMASESAMLGTPAIFLDNEGRGYTDELEQKYNLVYNFTESMIDQEKSIKKGCELLSKNNLKNNFKIRKKKMLSDTIDVALFITWFIDNYPKSVEIMKRYPDYQYKFTEV